jgi:1-deoxy-D-xylulose 5-phosphate reductoisomerase
MSQPTLAAVTVLGSTGSIGVSTLDVIRRHPDKYRIVGLTAATKVDEFIGQCLEFKPDRVALASTVAANEFRKKIANLAELSAVQVYDGEQGLCEVAWRCGLSPYAGSCQSRQANLVGKQRSHCHGWPFVLEHLRCE